jgi:hypothetical protein
MKKLFFILAVMAMALPAYAANWHVTFTYTKSPGPNLNHEVIEYPAGTQRCDLAAASPATCAFDLPVGGPFGQAIIVKSYDAAGTAGNVATYTGPVLNAQIAPSSGGTVTVIWVP